MGNDSDLKQLVSNAYDQLRILARRIRNNSLHREHETTSLVHEAYLRLSKNQHFEVNDEDHFVAVAAVAMRRLIIDLARKRGATKWGGDHQRVPLTPSTEPEDNPEDDLLDLDEALTRLSAFDARKCQVVELRFFAGCTVDQTAEALDVSPATVAREWDLARAWIYRELKQD